MFNFEYYTPTRVVFGKGAADKVGQLVKAQNCKKVLIHYGGGSVKRSGLLDRIKASLSAEGVQYVEPVSYTHLPSSSRTVHWERGASR